MTTPRWPLLLWLSHLLIPLGLAIAVLRVNEPLPLRFAAGLLLSGGWLAAGFAVLASPRGRLRLARNRRQLVLCAVVLLFALGTAEWLVRALSERDADGNVFFRGDRLRPFHLPVRAIAAASAVYHASADTIVIEDPLLGWKPRPFGRNALYAYDGESIRIDPDATPAPEQPGPPPLRILLFGDSFTHGDEVPWRETWACLLAEELEQRGVAARIEDLGVQGYGMDQAFLRWRAEGARRRPDLVVFGLQLENASRNVNLIRMIAGLRTSLPFSKPRFVLDGTGLRLVNSPSLPLRQLADTVADFEHWPLHVHESTYHPEDYRSRPWHWSRLATVADQRIGEALAAGSLFSAESAAVSRRIIEAFGSDVRAQGVHFMIVSLPRGQNLREFAESGELPGREFLDEIAARFPLVETESAFVSAGGDDDFETLFMPGGHYALGGNALVARALAPAIQTWAARRGQPPTGRAPVPAGGEAAALR